MENKLRRGLALLMTLIMLISCAPMDALAAIVPVPGGTQTSEGFALKSIVKPPVATHTYIFMNDFMNGDNKEFARQIVKDGEILNNPGTPDAGSSNNNKEFTGWRDGAGNAPAFGKAVTVNENDTKTITYHAQFADVYFVFFTNPDGEVMVTKKGANGETIPAEGVTYPVGNEESIVGWEDASGNLVSSVTLNGSDVTLTAKVENGHWITYDSQGGTYVEPAFVKGNGITTAPTNPTRPGYTFDHWSETVGGAAFTFGNALTTKLTLYAVWTKNTNTQYTVIHWQENADDDEYSYAESETKYGTTGAQTSAAAKSTAAGTKYNGFTAQTIAQQTIAGDGSTIVSVYYKRKVYDVKFYDRWGDEYTTKRITAKYGANIRDKWPGGTWKVAENTSTFQANIDVMPLNGFSFYETDQGFGKAYYYVEDLNGNDVLDHTDTGASRSSTVTKEDRYDITGFTCDMNRSAKNGSRYNGAKFYYTRNSYNVVYINNGGRSVTPKAYKYQQSIADAYVELDASYAPAGQEGYVFDGWFADPEGGQKYEFTGKTMPAQNITVYAKWNKPVYTGTIYLTIEGTGSSITLNVPKGDTIETALNEKQAEIMGQVGEGYTWRGWRTGKDGTGEPFNPQTQITTDITLYPYYTKNGTFKVEYDAVKNNVTAPVDGKSYAEGSFADLMSPGKLVADDGEYFLGWSDGAATYQPRDKYQIKSNHAKENVITLTAQWGARPAGTTLTYKANGGAGEDVVENLANNATVTTKPAGTFSRVGYTFKGWDTNPKGEGSIAPDTQVQVDNGNGENVLYAIWSAKTDTKYTVEFYYQNVGGTYTLKHSDKRTATTDTEASVTDTDKAAKENNKYVFEADNKNNVLSGVVAGNGSLVLKLYFKLNTASYTIHHYLNGTTVKVAKDQTGTKNIGEELTASASTALYEEYKKASVKRYDPEDNKITIGANADQNVITVYYTIPVTVTANNQSKVYGEADPKLTATVSGVLEGDEDKIKYTLSRETGEDVGDYVITPAGKAEQGEQGYYKVTYVPGTLTITKRGAGEMKVVLTAQDNTVTYDGQPHGAKLNAKGEIEEGTSYTITNLAEGHRVEKVAIKGTETAVGEYKDKLVPSDAVIVDKDGNNVSANYEITYLPGKLTITQDEKEIKVTANSHTWEYDGKAHSDSGYTVEYDGNKYIVEEGTTVTATLPNGDVVTATVEGTVTNVEDSAEDNNVVINVTITNKDGVEVSSQYKNVNRISGGLKITKRGAGEMKVVLTVQDNTVTYDGQPHGAKLNAKGEIEEGTSYTITNLAEGHRVEKVAIKGTETAVGEYKDKLVPSDAVIVDKDGNNVSANYEITYLPGKLTITQDEKEIKVTANSHTWEYDGKAHSDSGYTVEYDGNKYIVEEGTTVTATLPNGDVVTATVEGTVTNVEDSAEDNNVVINVTITNKDGVEVSSQYKTITTVNGGLKITRRPVQVTVNSKSFTYDAAEHTVADEHGKEYAIETAAENSGLLPGHTESLNVVYDDGTTKTESRKYVGTYTADSERDENGKAVVTITKEDSGEDVTANYAIVVIPGELEIKKAEALIKIVGPDSERVYNGQKQVVRTTDITTDPDYAPSEEEPDKIKILVTGLIPDDYIEIGTVIHVAEGTYVGKYEGNFEWDGLHKDEKIPTVLNDGIDVTQNYRFEYAKGWLTIKSNQPGEHPTKPDKEIDGHEPGTKYALGDRIYFTITVRNITNSDLKNVHVSDPTAVIVPGDGYTVVDEHHAKIENMPASVDGQEPTTVIINAYHVVTEDDIKNIVIDSGYKYENVATITVGDKTIDASKGTNDIEDADYTLKIEKQLINRPASGEKFKLGETAKFQITVTNEGNVTQTDIPVAEKLPGAVFTEGDGYTLNADKTVATITKVLNPADKETQHGDSIILYAQYTITENDLGNTGLKNIVTAPNGKPGEEPIPVDEAKSMAGQKIWNDLDNLYDTRTESVTVNLMRSLGRGGAAELIRTVTVTQNSGWRYSFDHLPAHDMQDNEYFYWVEEEPITGYETVYEMSDDSHCDIVNNLQTYTLTIHYWQHKLGDTKMEQAFPDYVATLYYKQPYDVESPEREGIILDDMSQARISGTMPAHDLVIDVYYHRIAYRLTIHYIYQDGTMAHEDYTWTYWFNSTYNVPSPIIPGFTPSIDVIAGRMPSHGLELTVVYVGDGEIVIPDEDTSLGFKSYLNAGECFE